MPLLLRRRFAGNGTSVPELAPRVRAGLGWAALLAMLAGCSTESRVPTTITLTSTTVEFTALGQTEQLSASVADQQGDPLREETVSWVSSNSAVASVSGTGLVSAAAPGSAQVTATSGSATAVAQVTVVQTPAELQKVSGDGQTVTVGETLPAPFVVRVNDALGNPVPQVAVTFSITQGGGDMSVSTATTTPEGGASTVLTTGTTAGSHQVSARITPSISVTFTATATAGPAASVIVASGDNQEAPPGALVPIPPSVRVQDALANPVPGVAVEFEVLIGGGSITGASTVTNSNGVAQVGSWTLGGSAGENQLRATAGGTGLSGNPVTFTATTATSTGYNIALRFLGSATPSQRQAFTDARARWESLIVGDLQNIPLSLVAGDCFPGSPALNTTVDDVLIFVTLGDIDGPGQVLGSAGPCFIRGSNNLPILGGMIFDIADLADLEAEGLLSEVILHEMGHVLGFGSLWPLQGLLTDPASSGGTDPHFTGAGAIAAFDAVGGTGYTAGAKVPVEDTGGEGSVDGHWRESVFDNELMTGFINPDPNPLSRVTIASLADQGYAVNLSGADSYSLPLGLLGFRAGPRLRLGDDLLRVPIKKVDPTGRLTGVLR
jgi:Big-like domain-containing protein/leishmanolysin